MTAPMGDLPDWETLVQPNILTASSFNQTGGIAFNLFQSAAPFRVWGVWISAAYSSNSAYVSALSNVLSEIQDGAGNTLLAIVNTLRVANQVSTGQLAIPLPGWTPQISGTYGVSLVSGASAANTDYRINGGIYYSQP